MDRWLYRRAKLDGFDDKLKKHSIVGNWTGGLLGGNLIGLLKLTDGLMDLKKMEEFDDKLNIL